MWYVLGWSRAALVLPSSWPLYAVAAIGSVAAVSTQRRVAPSFVAGALASWHSGFCLTGFSSHTTQTRCSESLGSPSPHALSSRLTDSPLPHASPTRRLAWRRGSPTRLSSRLDTRDGSQSAQVSFSSMALTAAVRACFQCVLFAASYVTRSSYLARHRISVRG